MILLITVVERSVQTENGTRFEPYILHPGAPRPYTAPLVRNHTTRVASFGVCSL